MVGALRVLLAWVTSVFRLGTDASMDPRYSKRVVLANQISFSLALLCIVHVYLDKAMGSALLAWLNIPIAFGYVGILAMNRFRFHWLSRITLITYAACNILFYSIALGKNPGNHLFFLPSGWAPLVLFNWEERKSLLYGVLLNSLFLVGFEVFGSLHGTLLPLPGHVEISEHTDAIITTMVIQILIAAYFFFGNHRAETSLAAAMESAKSADQAKSRFLANMSHEIRTPMNGILGITNLMIKAGMPSEKLEMAQTIQSSSLDLMTIINEILDLSKIEAGKMTLEKQPFNLKQAVDIVMRPFEYEANRKGLELRLEMDSSLPARVVGDSTRLKQVIRNLIGNAFKFTEQGAITLRVAPAADQADTVSSVLLSFEVEDNGIGIPPEAAGRIFQSFSQADDSTTRKYGGTGLGLFLCKQIVEMMGGTIGFTSRGEGGPEAIAAGKSGTVFRFTVRLEACPPDVEDESDASTRGRQGFHVTEGLRVLVVDDHPINRKVLEGLLEEFGVRPDMATDGAETLEACGKKDYHIIFMDCHMPGMDGLECTRALRRERLGKLGRRPTIIGVTADVMAGSREKCLAAGMDDVVTKPILEDDLERALTPWKESAPPSCAIAERPDALEPLRSDTSVDSLLLDQVRKLAESYHARGRGKWNEMLELFESDAVGQVERLKAAVRSDNLKSAGEALHSLKGLCMTMGLRRTASACQELEEATSGKSAPALISLAEKVEDSLTESLREIRKLDSESWKPV